MDGPAPVAHEVYHNRKNHEDDIFLYFASGVTAIDDRVVLTGSEPSSAAPSDLVPQMATVQTYELPGPSSVPLLNVGAPVKLDEKTPLLFKPITFKNMTLKNRAIVSPMCMYSAQDGLMNIFSLAHQVSFAIRGAALVIFEASGVTPHGRITPQCAGIWSDAHVQPMVPSIHLIHQYGAKAGIQLAHAGRKGSAFSPHFGKAAAHDTLIGPDKGGWPDDVIAPSAVQGWPTAAVPREMSRKEIEDVKHAFVDAAVRADKAGFDVIEIHGAHGYLIHQFLSPLSNRRTDEYGGSFENRIRFAVEIVTDVRKAWSAEKPLFVRLSVSDYADGGWEVHENAQLAARLYGLGVDLVDLTGGGLHPSQKLPYGPAFNLPGAREIRRVAPHGKIGLTGQLTGARQIETLLEDGDIDVAIIGREFLRNPNFVLNAASELGVDVLWTTQYGRAKKHRS
ncbi:hypothetical protein SeLEV6574_g01364 [Synchytrium endobioticum]|uniref:NADH:flavin oxidoreductase/NADH oxidase N-terminal domain-containing protein n=1 Tax=Synchytrium endobioticum TaxID=286115 RepID=A0A507DE98_9FUNG|nr:hypothetical protein SeLEV6574_g01364 [Synchytrium endobioticum]